jgi:TonB-linked SusC/RagA family outer membrane protein
MVNSGTRAVRYGGLVLSFLLVGTISAQAQTGIVTGRVTGSESAGVPGVGLEGARITVIGSNAVTFANREGVYFLRNLPAGATQVRASRLGYNQQTLPITVVDGQTVELNFTLAIAPYTLDEVVTTATGDQRKAELGNVVNTIQVDNLAKEAPIKTMADLLSGRAPGVTIIQSAGTLGSGTRVRIRGSNSVSLSNEPVFVVDGIRVESSAASSTLGVGGQSPSRINDINPDEIESIEIVKGPSAAALYGTRAANGVVIITTKRGSAGRPRWNAHTEQGISDDRTQYPDNVQGLTAANGPCNLLQVGKGQCAISSVQTFNPLLNPETRPLAKGRRQQYGVSVSGGSEQAQYFISAEQEWDRGVWEMPAAEQTRILETSGRPELLDGEIHPNSIRKTNLRANITAQVSPKMSVSVLTGFVDSDLLLPENDNNILGTLGGAMTGDGRGQTDPNQIYGFFPPGETFQLVNTQRIQRLTTSAQTSYNPINWLTLRGIVGVDLTSRVENELQRFGFGPDFGTGLQGAASENRRTISQYTVDFGGTTNFQLSDKISSKTSVGVQWSKDSFKGTNAFGQFLPPGSVTIGSGATQTASEVTIETIVFGSFAEQVFGYNDRVFVSGAVRGDRNSTFGQNFGTQLYPKAAISYLISDESFFPTGSFLSSFRLRAAWGASGLQPGSTDALLFFNPTTAAAPNGSDAAGVFLGGFGNADLKPETSRELELGFDATFFDSRLAFEATYYDKKSKDALINVQTPNSVGAPAARWQNIGAVRNKGVELTLNAQLFNSRNVSWDATFTGAFLKNEVTDLGDVPSLNLNGTDQQARVGTALGGYWARSINGWTDANGDGIVIGSELNISDTLEFQGPHLPTRELGLNTGISLFRNRVRLMTQLDYRGGHLVYNLNTDFRCRSSQNCLELYDNNTPLDERIRAAALMDAGAKNTKVGYYENGEFLKLREIAVTVQAPERWGSSFGFDQLSLTVSARNLHTWTGYTGLDPELNGQGQGNFAQREFFTQPPTRNISARLNVAF